MTMAMNGGYSVPIGVHKISCRSPGLAVTIDVHRRSPPVRRSAGQATNGHLPDSYTKNDDPIILAPNRFVEVAEVQQHGGRIRGRIIWEEVYDPSKDKSANCNHSHSTKDLSASLPHVSLQGKEPTKSSSSRFDKVHSIEKSPDEHHSKFRIGRPSKVVEKILPGKKNRGKSPNSTVSSNSNENNSGSGNNNNSKRKTDKIFIQYQGWISLQWTDDHKQQDHNNGNGSSNDAMTHKKSNGRSVPYADEDEGPWTEPVTLGVYRINFNGGLPLRKTSDRDSQVLDVLERGRHFEVLETSVKEDRVRARCLVPPPPITSGSSSANGEGKERHRSTGYQNGYISLANAVSGSTGVSPVPLGAYVAVADCGCPVTEGARLDTKMREVLVRGTCFEVTATRMEEGVVRGLVAWGGFVSLFAPGSGIPSKSSTSNGANGAKQNFTKHGNIRADGGINFAMPVPLGQYSIIYPHGLPVTAGFSRHTPIKTKLKLDDIVEVVETRVEDGKVRGRLSAIICAAGISRGWISIFDPSCRWAKFVGRDSGGTGNGSSGKEGSSHRHSQRGTSGRKLDF